MQSLENELKFSSYKGYENRLTLVSTITISVMISKRFPCTE